MKAEKHARDASPAQSLAVIMPVEQQHRHTMIFGKSVFQSVLDRIEEEHPEDLPEDAPSARIRGLSTGFVVDQMEGVSAGAARIGDAYLDLQPEELVTGVPESEPVPVEETVPVEPPPAPSHLSRLLPAEVAEDLGLTSADTVSTLQERRRAFALANHPDRVHEAHRDLANQRMMLANLLIDRAIARLSALGRLGLK